MTPFNPSRRGFATLFAVSMIALISVALLALSRLSVHESARTTDALAQAQVRQLLLAAQVIARTNLTPHKQDALKQTIVALPAELAGATLTVESEPGGPTQILRARGAVDRSHAIQVLRYTPDGQLASVQLMAGGSPDAPREPH